MDESTNRKTILIVDSDAVNSLALRNVFSSSYEIITSSSALDALGKLRSNKEIKAIILDISMPDMAAFQILTEMKKDSRLSSLPIIVDSVTDSHEDETRALSLGAWDFFSRPYRPAFMIQRMENIFGLEEQSLSLKNALTDPLTGLLTKDGFYAEASKLILASPRLTYDIVVGDIEQFKLINDLYGMKAGDSVLVATANMLHENLITGNNGIMGRIGPDSFACLTPHKETYDNDWFQALNTAINKATPDINVVLDYGIYQVHHRSLEVSTMCDRAILALNSIKGLYRVNFKVYDDSIREALMHEQYVVAHMEEALANKEFEVYYQGKFDIETGRIIGCEALVRWNDPNKGLVMPGAFIPIFEKNGFVSSLDRYVFETACHDIRDWVNRGHKEVVPCSVNVSRADIFNPNIDDIFLGLIKKYDLSPKMLHLEITESAYTENSAQLTATVKRLRNLGFVIEMDDFGTGYSSLNMLTEVSLDIVKLDVGFMQNHNKDSSRSVISFIISLSHSMGFEVIAEGVETKEQVELLKSLDFHYAQGFYYSKPIPKVDFEALFEKQMLENKGTKIEIQEKPKEPNILRGDTVFLVGLTKDETKMMERALGDNYNLDYSSNYDSAVPLLREEALGVKAIIARVNSKEDLEGLRILLRSSKELSIPVLTLNEDTLSVSPSLTLGAFDFIRPPFDEALISRRIKSAIDSLRIASFAPEKEVYGAFEDMRKRAEEDFLTGLLNRSQFEKEVDNFFADNLKPSGIFVMIDLDNLKTINDSEGHVKGDEAIVSIAKRLKDIFTESHTIGRLGGDEFAVFVPYVLPHNEVEKKIAHLTSSIGSTLTCSAGIAFSPENGISFESLYEKADTALLKAKAEGKKGYKFFEEGMETPFEIVLEKWGRQYERDGMDAIFGCDSVTGEMLYVNERTTELLNRPRSKLIGSRCFVCVWGKGNKCKRCILVDECGSKEYEEAITLPSGPKAMLNVRNITVAGRKIKLHRIRLTD